MATLTIVALALSVLGIVLAGIAYWRAGGRQELTAARAELMQDLEALKGKQRALAEGLSIRVRSGYEDSLARVRRAQERISRLKEEVSADLRRSVEAMSRQLADMKLEAEEGLARLKSEASAGLQGTQEELARRIRRIEGRLQVLVCRIEMARAERLAEKGDFVAAEMLLEEAVARVREVKTRLSDETEEDPAFTNVLVALQGAIHSVRERAEDHQRMIERVVSASDSLLASLEAREQQTA
jgi:hypothetical protein